MRTIEWENGVVVTIDQTMLPHDEILLELTDCVQVASAIKEMKIRGAPLIGVAAAYGLALTAYHSKAEEREELLRELERSADLLKRTRPTAVNLFWAVDRVLGSVRSVSADVETVKKMVVDEAERMADEDAEANRRIGEHGSKLIKDGDVILTHCNAGRLATVEYGTALAIVRAAWNEGKKISVIADETRPKLQGARLTAYELIRDGIPITLITDNMAGYVMSKGMVDKVIVGADRIVRDAVTNKIGTYAVAVLAHEHGIPFYVAAPISTFDLARSSKDVIIEERSPDEVTHIASHQIAPQGVKVYNPAFDITPLWFVSYIICEEGLISPSEHGNVIKPETLKRLGS
ncbi:MAG: S-methyl-5-thioribose-1-phosphate isomerase [Candidatus Bathyarchaeota archaeon]|nr:S-methyl-5-thioribose-1-phosphate isomerase [Candidatus Bathyarchaeota archaeon]